MNNPKISVIVPVYNVEKYLPCCMDALLNQTFTDIEIVIVVDKVSPPPDNCPAMCDEYAKQDHRVKVVHAKNEGLGLALNAGLEVAKGQFIAFNDPDDYIETHTYEKLISEYEGTNADVIYYPFQRFNDQGETWRKNFYTRKLYSTEEEIRELILNMISNPPNAKKDRNIECSVCCGLYRHDIIRKNEIRFKNEREFLSVDLLFNFDYLLYSSRVITIPDAFYHYRENPLSLSRALKPENVTQNHFLYRYLLEILEKNNFGIDGYLRATRLMIGVSRGDIRQYIQEASLSKKEKIQWLKKVVSLTYWKEIAVKYPYWRLPLKHALYFYLLYKRYCRLLYYYSDLKLKKK